MLTSLVLLEIHLLKALVYAPPDHHKVFYASQSLQQTLLNKPITSQIYLLTFVFLTHNLAGFVCFDYKGPIGKSIFKWQIVMAA